MTNSSIARKLAAIMFTDIVGFTNISVKNENKALAEKYINFSHDEIMDIASELKRGDKQRFLNDNILISNIISDWNRLTH